jgi:hypothetical protein
MFKVTVPEDDQSRCKHVALLVDYVKMLHFSKTKPTDMHYAAYLSGDVCDLKDYPMCAWFESLAGQ